MYLIIESLHRRDVRHEENAAMTWDQLKLYMRTALAGICLAGAPTASAESEYRTIAMMAPAERQAMVDAMQVALDDLLVRKRFVEDYPWTITAKISLDEAENTVFVDFDGRLLNYTSSEGDDNLNQSVCSSLGEVQYEIHAYVYVKIRYGGHVAQFEEMAVLAPDLVHGMRHGSGRRRGAIA